MMRKLFIGILMTCVLSACRSSTVSAPRPKEAPVSRSTATPVPLTATPELPPTAAPHPTQPNGMEYDSVAEALAGLKSRDDVSIQVLQGWTIVVEADGLTNWSFPPPGHPAYPALAKRALYRDQDGWHLTMDILCEAEPVACDDFIRYFEMMNEPMYQYIAQHQ